MAPSLCTIPAHDAFYLEQEEDGLGYACLAPLGAFYNPDFNNESYERNCLSKDRRQREIRIYGRLFHRIQFQFKSDVNAVNQMHQSDSMIARNF